MRPSSLVRVRVTLSGVPPSGAWRSSSTSTPAAGRPRVTSSTCVVSFPVAATGQALRVMVSRIVPKAGNGGTKTVGGVSGSSPVAYGSRVMFLATKSSERSCG